MDCEPRNVAIPEDRRENVQEMKKFISIFSAIAEKVKIVLLGTVLLLLILVCLCLGLVRRASDEALPATVPTSQDGIGYPPML